MKIAVLSSEYNRKNNNKNKETVNQQIESIEDFDRKFLIPMAEYIESLLYKTTKK